MHVVHCWSRQQLERWCDVVVWVCRKQACPINTTCTWPHTCMTLIVIIRSRQSMATSNLVSRLARATTHAPVSSRQKVNFKGLYTVTVCKTTGALRILARHYNIKASCRSAHVVNSMQRRYQHCAESCWCNWHRQCSEQGRWKILLKMLGTFCLQHLVLNRSQTSI